MPRVIHTKIRQNHSIWSDEFCCELYNILVLRQHVRSQKATFIEKPLDELEKEYDPTWLQEKVVKCDLVKSHVLSLYQHV